MKYTLPDGFCKKCGQPYWQDEHDHKTFGTLSPEAAAEAWQKKLLMEREAEEYASKSGEQLGNVQLSGGGERPSA